MQITLKNTGLLLILLVLMQTSFAQETMVFSIDEPEKQGTIFNLFSPVEDNYFDLTLRINWTDRELKPVDNNMSVVGFYANDIKINSEYVELLTQLPEDSLVAFNHQFVLNFEVDERFPGGDIKFDIPFFFAPSLSAAEDSQYQKEFSFARPRKYMATNNVKASSIVDKTPPDLVILSPDGVEEGLKPFLNKDNVKVELKVNDFFGVERVAINEMPVRKVNDSTYVADLVLRRGFESTFNIVAEDVNGHITEREFAIENRASSNISESTSAMVIDTHSYQDEKEIDEPSELIKDLPELEATNPHRFALIIGNEDYSTYQTRLNTESDVDFARRDANTFRVFAEKILGVHEENVIFLLDATEREMRRALNQINALSRALEGNAEIFVYYAGHGFPDEKTREPYLIPVDVSGSELEYAIKLTDFYEKLTEHPAERITVFLDACFSGGGREQGLLAARSIRVRPKEGMLSGNLVVFAASTGDQSALPWVEKKHGMFTYNLLEQIKEKEGHITYGELSEYLKINVARRSILHNQKEQNPQLNISPSVRDKWQNWKLRE